MGPLAQAPLRSRSPDRCVLRWQDSTHPVDWSRLGHQVGQPYSGSDRVSEALLLRYQRSRSATRIITAVFAPSNRGLPL
jgi:hypothetical protein